MTPLDVMQRLAATNSRTDKEQIVFDAFMQNCEQFFIGARWALDSLITFGIAKVPEITTDDGSAGNYSFTEFLDLANRLRSRELTGNRARAAIHEAAVRCHAPTWNLFYRRILLKDLNVGVDAKTINKVLQKLVSSNPQARDYLITVFSCQLAHDGEDAAHRGKIRGRKLIDTKLDGVRILAALDVEAGTVSLFTRNGQVLDNFSDMHQALRELLTKLPGSMMLDGELISPKGFQHLMTMLRRKEPHDDMTHIRYALFDILPLNDFRAGRCAKTQHERHGVLELMQECGLRQTTNGRVYVVPKVSVDLDTDDGQKAFAEFNRQAIANGFEGIMVKDPEAPYEGKRTAAWLKSKPVIEVSLEVVGFANGDPDSKYRHTLGALICRGEDDGKLIESNVGGGISDELREEIYNNQDRYRGMIAEIRADKITLEEGSSTYSLRFPRLKGFRGRIAGEKL